mmetsp:Transcript_110473/g.191462  ORF Transcript_110473/g.191462 Transcript_110473/m.191462 type:complete len:118 (+) Transcript_110473:1399-1752(+)
MHHGPSCKGEGGCLSLGATYIFEQEEDLPVFPCHPPGIYGGVRLRGCSMSRGAATQAEHQNLANVALCSQRVIQPQQASPAYCEATAGSGICLQGATQSQQWDCRHGTGDTPSGPAT